MQDVEDLQNDGKPFCYFRMDRRLNISQVKILHPFGK
jgi:hypothetical protein